MRRRRESAGARLGAVMRVGDKITHVGRKTFNFFVAYAVPPLFCTHIVYSTYVLVTHSHTRVYLAFRMQVLVRVYNLVLLGVTIRKYLPVHTRRCSTFVQLHM